MKRLLLLSVVALLAATASADIVSDAHFVAHFDLGQPAVNQGGVADVSVYDNQLNFTGYAFANGGAENQSGNIITRLVADDCTMIGPATTISQIYFSVANLDTAVVTARARIRFYQDAGGVPGTYITGYSFNPIAFPTGVSLYYGTVAAGPWPQLVWAGMTFDNNTGGTGATLAQMNNLGQGIFSPVASGSSQDLAFETTAAGSFLQNNPPGATFNFSGAPPADFGWKFVGTPEPASLALMLAGALFLRRR